MAYLLKSKKGFLALDALLAMLCISVITMTCNLAVKSEIEFRKRVDKKWEEIVDKESEILSSIKSGCGLGCLNEMDLR